MRRRAIRGMAAILAVGSAPGLSTAEPTASSPLELIGAAEIPFGARFQGYPIGGLSGLDRLPGGDFIAISDDKGDGRQPRFYQLAITLDPAQHRARVRVKGQAILRDAQDVPFPIDRPVVDPEAIRHGDDGHVYWSSEGTWSDDPARRVQPGIYESDATGRVLRSFSLPAAYLYTDNKTRGAVSNGVLEGLAAGPTGTVYAINEVPAYEDGVADGGSGKPMRHRLTSFDPKNGKPLHQYVYEVPDGQYSVSELLAVDDRHFLSIERIVPFDAKKGVDARIVLSGITDRTTDVLSCPGLKSCPAIAMTRTILLDLPKRYRGIKIDNLEGLAWGPSLADNRRTLIVEADNNFNKEEVSQFLVFAWSR
ncbi:esterase-like activity of phytase family protein [Sphingomonas lacusdianchii]|uniref:esterase-like activity of phytase family protein n=1 Tax=Sphingomonas lacusdianchii TaxID=2917992 RepID=UPI001F58413F|nr:esterase-like activity of phytase family protein [Sphingomonas sp. JXJ CY 53]